MSHKPAEKQLMDAFLSDKRPRGRLRTGGGIMLKTCPGRVLDSTGKIAASYKKSGWLKILNGSQFFPKMMVMA